MFLIGSLFHWWYGDGLLERVRMISGRLDGMIDYFSFGLLLKTLFSPYRQISAGSVDGSLEVKLRAMADKLFSRVIGAFIRLIILIVGAAIVGSLVAYSIISLIVWSLVPLLPVAGVGMMIWGWTPPWINL